MRNLKILAVAAAMVASAVVGGTLISVVAASGQPSAAGPSTSTLATDTDPGVYCQTFLDAFAKQLGVDESALVPAAKAAIDAAIDKAVADGKLSKALGDQLKQKVANANGNGCGILGARLGAALKGIVRTDIRVDLVQAAANALHLSVADLRSKVAGGESLKQIAADQKVDYATVTSAIHDAAKADLDKLVNAGKLTQARENAILDRLDKALQNGKLGAGKVTVPGVIRPFLRPGPAAPSTPSGSTAPNGSGSSS